MTGPRSLTTLVKRGALVTAANWPVVLVQFTAESLLKILVGVPVVGGFILLVLVVGLELPEASMSSLRDIALGVLAALAGHPAGLAGFLLSLAVAGLGGSALTFIVKAGTLTVLVEGDRQAGDLARPPLRWSQVVRARAWTPERFLAGCQRLWRRFLRLGLLLMLAYGLLAAGYFAAVLGSYRLAPAPEAWGPALTAGMAAAIVVTAAAVANLLYLLIQMVMVADDVGVRTAAGRVASYLRREGRWVVSTALVVLTVVVIGMVASIVTAGALGLISFVPVLGLAVVPLQAIAWLLRGLLFQFIGFSAFGAYLTLYRGES